mgnify:CR=1 FL=1|jgi:hypothetical protein
MATVLRSIRNSKVAAAQFFTLLLLVAAIFNSTPALAGDDVPSDDEMEGINKIVKDTEVMKLIRNQADAHERSLNELHHNIEEQLKAIHDNFEAVVDNMRNKEHDILLQVEKLETRLLGKVNAVAEDSEKSTGWFWPFVLLLLFLGGIVLVSTKRMKEIEKKDTWYNPSPTAKSWRRKERVD